MNIYNKIERHESGYIVLEVDADDSHHFRLIACCTSLNNAVLVRQGLDLLIMKKSGRLCIIQPLEEEYVEV